MMQVSQFVAADRTVSTTTGTVIPPMAGAVPTADGVGGAAWAVPAGSNLADQTKGLADQAQPLAPAGLRDTWQIPPGLGFGGQYLYRFDGPDILLSSSGTNHYSLDGGDTWAPVIFDVPPTIATYFGYDGVGTYVAISYTSTDPTYTSVDGINFVAGPPLGVVGGSWQILWVARLGLWVTSILNDATHWISTSPDGIVWTPRLTPDFSPSANGTVVIDSGALLVLLGDGAAAAWSDDGITWTAGLGIAPGVFFQAGCYSPERDEFIATGGATSTLYRSDDGKVWTDLGLVGVPITVSATWVGHDIQRYYIALRDYSTGLYSVFTSRDPQVEPFVTTTLAGAVENNQDYSSVVYDVSRKRFLLGLTSVGVAYSTDTPYTIKSITDNINVRGYPVIVSKYARLADGPSVGSNSTAEASLYPSGASVGSLAFPKPQAVGTTIRARWGVIATVAVGSVLTLRLNADFLGGPSELSAFTFAGPLAGEEIVLDATLTIVGANSVKVLQSVAGSTTASAVQVATKPGWDPSIANALAFTAQFDVANPANGVVGNLAVVDVSY